MKLARVFSTGPLASASARHPWRVVGAWIAVFVLAVVAIVTLLGDGLSTDDAPTNNPESERAIAAQIQAFPPDPRRMPSSDIVVIHSDQHTVDSPEFESFVRTLVVESDVLALSRAHTYLEGNTALVSADRRATIVPLGIPDEGEAEAVIEAVERADEDAAFSVAVTGDQTLDYDFNLLSQEDLEKGELQFGLPAALIILLLVFGAVVAGLIPLLMAIVSIVVALGLTALLAQPFELSIFIVNMLTGMGLALGIDYSLFVVSRYREERGRGHEQFDAIAASGLTASRAVLFSGTAFVVAMFGMLLVPNSIMRSLAVGAILVGIVSVVAALTLLPALLGLLGDRVNALRIPIVGRRTLESAGGEGRFWGAIVRSVLRRPVLSLVLSLGVLVALALPILAMNVGTSGVSALPDRFSSKQGFLALERNFPGSTTDPVEIVVSSDSSDSSRAEASAALDRLRTMLAGDPRFGTGEIRLAESGDVSVASVPVAGDPSSSEAVAAVRELRSELVPQAFEGTDAEVLVGGTTSENIDYFASVIDPAPLVIAFVLLLTFLLLTVVFRSVVVAATAVALNLLSVGAAYGLLVLVFQYGIAADLLGFQETDTIEAWVPLFLFSVLFGLSMDYQVFLLSRIRERYDETRDTTDAVTFGVGSTARIITGAALIIVAVFSGFARGDLIMFQQMGFGVAVALLIDATIIRSVLLPSAMRLLGRWNWYLPSWLEWLPRLQVEGSYQGSAGTQTPLEPSRN
ncbi:MAG: MMPL family transporter [Actinobacteria bacterium]|nr:MMPL family transporter [Actinomycetota bacterium]